MEVESQAVDQHSSPLLQISSFPLSFIPPVVSYMECYMSSAELLLSAPAKFAWAAPSTSELSRVTCPAFVRQLNTNAAAGSSGSIPEDVAFIARPRSAMTFEPASLLFHNTSSSISVRMLWINHSSQEVKSAAAGLGIFINGYSGLLGWTHILDSCSLLPILDRLPSHTFRCPT